MTDRDEQIRRIATALLNSGLGGTVAAPSLYEAGLRMPAPPAPTMPVVSDRAIKAYQDAVMSGDGTIMAGLRAAWPFLVRDNLAALERDDLGSVILDTRVGYFVREEVVRRLARALGAALP